MKRLMTSFTRSNSTRARSSTREERLPPLPSPDDPPETAILKAIVLFCASGGPSSAPGSEVLYLPTIVDSAESSPTAAKEAATAIRKQLDLKHNTTHPYKQYNAIMLLRILSDNPGRTFTRNLSEPKFIGAVKDLLRQGRDPSVRQILGETLEYWEVNKGDDEALVGLKEVWIKDKKNMNLAAGAGGAGGSRGGSPTITYAPGSHPHMYAPRTQSYGNSLPPMVELTARISEARTSASLLEQVLQSTPPAEVPKNELVKEFADRCKSATRSIVSYIQATDPSPDEDTLTTLIETNDFLGMVLERYKSLVTAALEKERVERASQVSDARIVNVGDAWEAPYAPTHAEDERRDVPAVHGAGAGHGTHEEHSADGQQILVRRRSGERGRPDSPVSPVSPEHPVSYRY